MKAKDFAAMIGHGVAMLQKVESGSKKLPAAMALDIARATGVSVAFLLGDDSAAPPFVDNPGLRGADDFHPYRVLHVFADAMAGYCAATEHGVNGQLLLGCVRDEIERFLQRWGIEASKLQPGFREIMAALEDKGDQNFAHELLDRLEACPSVQRARGVNDGRTKVLNAAIAFDRRAGRPPSAAIRRHTDVANAKALARLKQPRVARRAEK